MIDIKILRNNPEIVRKSLINRNMNSNLVDDFLAIDEEWRSLIKKIDDLKFNQKELTRNRNIEESKKIKEEIKNLEDVTKTIEIKRNNILELIPNIPFDDVLIGKDENENKVLKEVGEKPKFDFSPRDYLEIAEDLDLIDTKKASEVSGSRFGYLKNEAAILEFGLIKLAFDVLLKEGFIPIVPPVLIKPEVYQKMGRLSGDQKEERYYLAKDNLYLVGSAEHTLGPLHLNDIFEEKDLPRRYVGFSTCFRREAGSYGKDTKGILRVHQFDKVEMFSFSKPENSEEEHKYLLSLQEKLMTMLKLPYRVVEICTGDMGFTDARQFDIETWLPGQLSKDGKNKGIYRETHSCSNTTDFQARGINARIRRKNGSLEFVHMLNATGFAIGRIIIAILENYQTKDGKIIVPEVLRDYLKKEIIG
ncbi:MAG: serine--tRNA ligase [Patescibacteria group bacterium]|nr:serine--tRNA ligase [Patescibacteria group bacterium]